MRGPFLLRVLGRQELGQLNNVLYIRDYKPVAHQLNASHVCFVEIYFVWLTVLKLFLISCQQKSENLSPKVKISGFS